MRKKVPDMEWNVIRSDFNSRKIETFNIFRHGGFSRDIANEAKKCKSKDEFLKRLRGSLMYYFWCKCEWEVIVGDLIDGDAKRKIDVYWQVMNNWHIFSEYVCTCLGVK